MAKAGVGGTPVATPPVDERAVVQLARSGDREAFALLVQRYQNAVGAVAFCLTGQLSLSEDVAQETFLVAWRRLDEFNDSGRFRPWVLGIARHCSLRALREQGKKVLGAGRTDLAEFPSLEPSPLERAISREEEQLIWRALRKIPEKYRIPLVLFYREEKSLEKVAEILQLSLSNAGVRLTRGRRMLHDQFMAVVESALGRSRLGKPFTAGVLAAVTGLPAVDAPAAPADRGDATAVRFGAGKAAVALLALSAAIGVGESQHPVGHDGPILARSAAVAPRGGGESADEPRRRLRPPQLQVAAPPADPETTKVIRNLIVPEDEGRFPFSYGKLAPCPAGIDGPCVIAMTDAPALAQGRWPWAITTHPLHVPSAPGLLVSFDYWLGDADTGLAVQIDLRIGDVESDCCWQIGLADPVHRGWGHVEIPLTSFEKHLGSGGRVAPGAYDAVGGITLSQKGAGNRGFYVANLRISQAIGAPR